MSKITDSWTMIDCWDLDEEADGPMLMIVQNGNGNRYLLGKFRQHPAMPAIWCQAIRLLPTDTRATLEADAGCNLPMPLWYFALNGFDSERTLVVVWTNDFIRKIVDTAK